jgi:hypothetical protein
MRWRKGGGSGTEKGLTKLAGVIGPEVLRGGKGRIPISDALRPGGNFPERNN